VAGFLEREGLLVRDDDNDYLALDGLKDAPMLQIQGYFITYRIAIGKQQGRKVFTLQTNYCTYGRGLRQAVPQMWQASVSMQVS
jgi:hypothetical protein